MYSTSKDLFFHAKALDKNNKYNKNKINQQMTKASKLQTFKK